MPRSYDTEIISVGTELLLGHVTNTDSRDISELLSKIGINVRYHTVVGDNPERLESCIEIAKQRADIIITTGGLGPTCDDLTKVITARAFGLELVEVKSERRGCMSISRTAATSRRTTIHRLCCRRAARCSTIPAAPRPAVPSSRMGR